MATKGEATRRRIVEQAVGVFNQRGYWGTSLADLMAATGLEKGGIYNHFGSKEALALEAFDHATGVVRERLRSALARHHGAPARLLAVVDVFRSLTEEPPYPGGCPILNTAVESDHSHPALRERTREVMDDLRATIVRIVRRGVERGELVATTDAQQVASVLVASLEGAIMLTQLYGDASHVRRVAAHLADHIAALTTAAAQP